MHRLLLTSIVIGCLWAAYRGYARWISPLTTPLPPPPTANIDEQPVPVKPAEFSVTKPWLRGADWTEEAKFKIQHAENAYIFFDAYESFETKVELKPFAMVWYEGVKRRVPYVIQCQSARLTFERPFKIGGETPGRMLGAVLTGEFRITGPHGLTVDGEDCRFSEQAHQLYSDRPIKFQYSPDSDGLKIVRGNADKLQIDFEPATYAVHGRDMPRVGDVVSITLRRAVNLLFQYETKDGPASTRVLSDGPFSYDFPRRLATFQDNVRVARPKENPDGSAGHEDLQAHWLALQFEPTPKEGVADGEDSGNAVAELEEEESSLGKLRLRSLRAVGKTASDPVQVASTPANFTGTMNDLQYDAVERRLLMQDPEHGVRLNNGEVTLLTPAMQLLHDESGELTYVEAMRNGRLDFERPGKGDEAPQKFHALWTRRMDLTPEPERDLTIVVLEGDARVIQPGEMGILCDRLTLDVDSENVSATERGVAASRNPDELPLKHALAEGNVAMAGRQFQVETSRLDVTFESGRLPKGPTGKLTRAKDERTHPDEGRLQRKRRSATTSPSAATELRLACLTEPTFWSRAVSQWSVPSEPIGSQPTIVVAARPAAPLGLKSNDHWSIRADSINAIVLQDPSSQETEVREVVGVSDVHIVQTPPQRSSLAGPSDDDEQPLVVMGQRLHLVNSGGFDQALHLTGSPAHLDRGGIYIEGDELFFDRELNTARVIGRGMMKSPVRQGISGEKSETPSQLVIHWAREMIFDGSVARYVEAVRTRLDDSVMTCDEMTVTLNRRVDFSSERPDTEGLGIQSVLCERGVTFEYLQWGEQQELLSRAEGRAGEFELRYDTGDFVARGGGKIDFWQQNEESRVDVERKRAARANQPVAVDELPWQYTNVVFHDRTTGNMRQKHATLFDRVWVTHAPVERALQRFTRDDLSRDNESSRNGVWMGSDELTISLHPWPGRDEEYIQVLGVGTLSRVELEGRTFQANADVLTYDESTKLFTLQGRGENPASVSMQDHPGAEYRDSTGQRIQFNPAKPSVFIQGSKGASGGF